MPVLRSREIPPPPNPSSLSKTLKKGFIEPSTPAKTTEFSTNSSRQQPIPSPNPPELMPNSIPPPRRSSRLASKSNSEETAIPVDSGSSSIKRRRRGNENGGKTHLLSQTAAQVKNSIDFDSLVLITVKEEETDSRVSDSVELEEVVEEDGVNGSLGESRKKRRGWEEEIEVNQENGYLSLRSGMRVTRRTSLEEAIIGGNMFEVKEDKGKGIQIEGDDSGSGKKMGNGYLGLRSGMRVTRRASLEGGSIGGDMFEVKEDKGKGINIEGDDSGSGKKMENGYLSLRSGMRVTRRTSLEEGSIGGDMLEVKEDKGKGINIEGDDSGSGKKVENGYLSLWSGMRVTRRTLLEEGSNGGDILEIKEDKGKGILIEGDGGNEREMGDKLKSPRKFTREEKGKGKLTNDDELVLDVDEFDMLDLKLGLDYPDVDWGSVKVPEEKDKRDSIDDAKVLHGDKAVPRSNSKENADRSGSLRNQFKDIARRNASKYAHFNAQEEEEEESADSEAEEEVAEEQPPGDVEYWPGPFFTAMKIIKDREKNLSGVAQNLSSEKENVPIISWTPRQQKGPEWPKRAVPMLQNLCLTILAENVDAIASLNCVPDSLRHKLCQMLCDLRRMNVHFLDLLLDGSPSEIRLPDCSWLEEDKFEELFEGCNTNNLMVLQLDLGGHCITDSSLLKALVPKGLPALTMLSLKGACRISDAGLSRLVSTAPAVRSMNLSQCSLLTYAGIESVAKSLGSILQELYLDFCDGLKARHILPALKRLKRLEVLSLRGIESVSNKFIRKLITSNGANMKELNLANCIKLTDSSLKVIAESCPQLCVLDISHLSKLTDVGLAYLANGCRKIQDLSLCRSRFSDDTIAAFLEASGESLRELSLNNIAKVGQNTAISLAKRCKNLQSLDLSWCRCLTDEAMGIIVDSCLSLKLLKIFGCTQITNMFLEGHSNPNVQIIGLKLTPILDHIKRPDFQQGPLHYSAVPSD